jgi:MFS superfamily sulfate permease-like transporter
VAVRGLIDLPALARLWRVSRGEFAISMVALAGVLLLGILKGVLVAVIVSLLVLVRRRRPTTGNPIKPLVHPEGMPETPPVRRRPSVTPLG